jgi:hypothetical protein
MTEKDKPEIVVNRGVSALSEPEKIIAALNDEVENILHLPASYEGDEDIIAFPAFGARRLKGQELMIELRLKDGKKKALAYAYLVEVDYCPVEGITMIFVGHRVRIEGRNLSTLFDFLVRHAVNFVSEKDSFHDTGDDQEIFVSGIDITPNE